MPPLRAHCRGRLRAGCVLGLLFGKAIKAHLIAPLVVATTFVLGGLVILWAERRTHTACIETIDDMRPLDALWVGLAQCLALVPGTSRSGATIIGAMLLGSSRKAVTEFSFFLSLPTWIGAGLDSLWKERALLAETDIALFGVGLVFSFLAAWVCVRWLLRFISSHTFVPFAWHRIAFGIIVRGTAFSGLVTSAD